MQKYSNSVQDLKGNALVGAVITVTNSLAAIATIYSDDGITPKGNPFAVDAEGEYSFFAANGEYTIAITYPGVATQTYTNVRLFDPTDAGAVDSANATFIQSGAGAVATTVQAELRSRVSVKQFGAVGDGVTDDGPAFNLAIESLPTTGGTVFVPRGTYRIATTIRIGSPTARNHVELLGDGNSGSKLVNDITGATSADPCILATETASGYITIKDLYIVGNAVVGAGGNGHGIAFIDTRGGAGTSSWAPQNSTIERVYISDHYGFGKDSTGAAMPASGIYSYASMDLFVVNSAIYRCKRGYSLHKSQKMYVRGLIIDQCTDNCFYISDAESVNFKDTTLNQSGNGGSTDALIYIEDSESVTFHGGRWKNGNPYIVRVGASGKLNKNVLIDGIQIAHLDPAMGSTCIYTGTGQDNVTVRNCHFEFVNTISTGIGIDVTQIASGITCNNFSAENNSFTIGGGGTLVAAIRVSTNTNLTQAPRIIGNRIGPQSNASSATSIQKGVALGGFCRNAVVESNVFIANSNVTITDAVHIASNNVVNSRVMHNSHVIGGTGAITSRFTNLGTGRVIRNDFDSIGDSSLALNALKPTRVISSEGSPTSIATAGNVSYTAEQIFSGIIVRDCAGASRSDTLPSAADIVATTPAATIGDIIRCLFINGSDAAETITMNAGAGGGFDANQTAASRVLQQNSSKTAHIRLTNVGSGTEAYVVYF